ncbi:MAG: phage tail protein [Candidatus Binataceae bacterium]
MAELSIQPSINDRRSQALLALIERLDTLDLTPILVYRLDSAPDSALLPLAWQFDMLAPQWQLGTQLGEAIDSLDDIDILSDIDTLASPAGAAGTSDYDSWRELLKLSIPLHRTRGTAYTLKTALASLGWSGVTIQEGQATWGGTQYPASQGWALFRVVIEASSGQEIPAAQSARAIAAINFFKPARAWLDSLWFTLAPVPDFAPTPEEALVSIYLQRDSLESFGDNVSATAWLLSDTRSVVPRYNAHFYHSGLTYGAQQEVVVDSGVTINGAPVSSGE